MPKISESKRLSNKKWNDANMKIRYDRIQLVVPKGRKQTIEDQAKANNETVNGYINRLARMDAGMTEEEWKDREQAQ